MDVVSFYNFKYALIKDGVVENVIICDSYPTAGRIAEATGCDEAVWVDQYLVTIGDKYENGVFYHNGNEIERQLTLEEKAERAEQRNDDLELAVAAILGGAV